MRNLVLFYICCNDIVLDLPFYWQWRGRKTGRNALLLMDYAISG